MERLEHSDLPDGVTCKEVAWPLETAPLLSEEIRALARDLAVRQGLEPGCVFGHVLPQGLRQVDLRIRWLAADRDFSCTVKQVGKLDVDFRQALAVALCRGEASGPGCRRGGTLCAAGGSSLAGTAAGRTAARDTGLSA